ncbi:TPA: collagenase-like protease [Candidatus Gastranaerophilales bacterium HUM_9]|nr:MAG TPA: collagenase-like protease [Candidatus Gastranaerophilales bacterium HUM_9]HBX34659.1 collagenase-like protease [Cyanobacteria bacterium UBA11440]
MKTELLAPAKNIDIAKQAIDCGADAVYIGSVSFGARQNASNSIEDIKELVNYAHKFYVKVFVTVNTIISDNEINDVKKLIKKLYEIGVDALIIQDMAILEMFINGELPPIPLHISTQCDNRSVDKVGFFSKMCLPRVVLARELSLKQIEEIHKMYPKIELECFIHGALCVSYSGQCYLSQFIGGRSANKGQCAQPCRKRYSLIDDKGNIIASDKHLLSLKDFNTSDIIEKMVDIGVKSFKIEGRLKDEVYVKNVVGFYRQKLDKISEKTSSGKVVLGFEPDLKKSFNRGYTHYFLEDRNKCFNFDTPKFVGEKLGTISKITDRYFEIKNLKTIINKQDGLCFGKNSEFGCIVNNVEGNKIFPNKMNKSINVGVEVFRNLDRKFEDTVLKTIAKRQIGVDISYNDGVITICDEDKNSVLINIEETELVNNKEKMIENFKKSFSKTGESDFYIDSISIKSDLPFIPVSKVNEYRRIAFDKLMIERLKNYKREIQKPLNYTKFIKEELDYRANVHNSLAEKFYKKCSSEVIEHSFESKVPYRQVELMRTKHCLKYAFDMGKSPRNLILVDEKGVEYPLKFDCKHCEMCILSPEK